MSRIWTARKRTTFDPGAVTAGAAAPYTLSRAGPEAAPATKQALRLLTGYTLLFLPLHLFVCYLSAFSLSLTVGLVLVTAGALLAVALARWLALDDLLQKLPLLLVLVLVGGGLVFLSSQSFPRGLAGGELLGGLFLLIAVVSVLASLYRPMAVTYQAVTMKTPFRDLCVAAAALLASLALAAISHVLPKFLLVHCACAACGCYAGLVVTEYAAWARANPAAGLERRMSFESASPRRKEFDPLGAVLGAAIFGASLGVLSVFGDNVRSPSRDFVRFVIALGGEAERAVDVLALILWLGLVGLVFGFLKAGHSLGTVKPGNPVTAAQFAWQALVVFLTYPEVKHPLVHQLRIRWLRPPAVRAALTCAVLVTVATALNAPAERPRQATSEEKSATVAPAVTTRPAAPREIPPGDREFAWISGQRPEVWLGPDFAPPAAAPAPAANAAGAGALSFADRVLGLVVLPPLCLALMVFSVGLSVLPTYGGYFETDQTPASPK